MSIQIADRPTEFCLPSCPYMGLRVQSETVYADGVPSIVYNVVSCENEAVCKMWHDREIPKNEILTWAELKAMSGERVWCVEKGRYCLIEQFGMETLACHEHSDLYFGLEGFTFYRRKPNEMI